MPAGAVYVGRPTIWGNPFRITRSSDYHGLPGSWFLVDDQDATYHPDEDTQRSARQKAVDLFTERLLAGRDARLTPDLVRAELAGRDLVCWCPLSEPCHADALLRIANAPVRAEVVPARCPTCGVEQSAEASRQPLTATPAPSGAPAARSTCPGCGRTIT